MRIGFYSGKRGKPWGADEEMWGNTALALIHRGHTVGVCFKWWPNPSAHLEQIEAHGGRMFWREQSAGDHTNKSRLFRFRRQKSIDEFDQWCEQLRPHLIHFKGGHRLIDNVANVETCWRRQIPYVINVRGLDRGRWFDDHQRHQFRQVYGRAEMCYLLSEDNLDILETQLAMRLPNVEIIDNSFGVRSGAETQWPSSEPLWRLACVGSLYFPYKAQDVILKVLALEQWRNKPLQVVFWGSDKGSAQHMRELIECHGIDNRVEFGGFTNDIENMWSQHHAMLLPSRVEGNSRAVMEAMVCGRVPIVTKVGRNPQLVEDNETGFLAAAPNVELVNEAMLRAWDRRHQWREMGQLAAKRIRERFSMTPIDDYADQLEIVAERASATASRRRNNVA